MALVYTLIHGNQVWNEFKDENEIREFIICYNLTRPVDEQIDPAHCEIQADNEDNLVGEPMSTTINLQKWTVAYVGAVQYLRNRDGYLNHPLYFAMREAWMYALELEETACTQEN